MAGSSASARLWLWWQPFSQSVILSPLSYFVIRFGLIFWESLTALVISSIFVTCFSNEDKCMLAKTWPPWRRWRYKAGFAYKIMPSKEIKMCHQQVVLIFFWHNKILGGNLMEWSCFDSMHAGVKPLSVDALLVAYSQAFTDYYVRAYSYIHRLGQVRQTLMIGEWCFQELDWP